MPRGGAEPSRQCLDIEIDRSGDDLQVKALGSRDERPAPHGLAPAVTSEALSQFTINLREAALRAAPLGEQRLEQSRSFHQALFRGELETVKERLREAAGGEPLLVRFLLRDGALQAFPWEALCEPQTQLGFLGNSPKLLPVRGVLSKEPWQPREVRGAVRVLAVAPMHEGALARLRSALGESIDAGEVEWLEPLTGSRTRKSYLLERLRSEPIPHVIHFIGHGGVRKGVPALRLADDEDEESWVEAELLAQQLQAGTRGYLRLVVLEACEGAAPGEHASAAELLTRDGADAVVAHLWPVKADVAELCSKTFYRTLTGRTLQHGDVAFSLNEARRTMLTSFKGSAEAFSPVLYLRARNSILFDFKGRKIVEPPRAPARASPDSRREMPAALRQLLSSRFSLVLGDRWMDEGPLLESFRQQLQTKLVARAPHSSPEGALSTLAQHYALHIGEQSLDSEFKKVFRGVAPESPLVEVLARGLPPGVHITLMRRPVLENALARHHSRQSLYTVQPPLPGSGEDSPLVMRYEADAESWEPFDAPLESIDPERDYVVLRLYSGYLPSNDYRKPLLTEDDYLLGIHLGSLLPPVLADPVLRALNRHPALLLGMSLHTWHHRMMLYRLFGKRPLPIGSLVTLEPGEPEQSVWVSGKGLPGRVGIQAIEAAPAELSVWLDERARGKQP
ncbi:CHAT domain-containing protein [Archangium gephyra]|nr:CHAT domain-containing protein [Archangium gephyra]